MMDKPVKLYGLPYCDGTIAVTKWLEAKGFTINLHNYKTDGITADKLFEWSKALGWERLLNKRSTTWRSLSKDEQDKVVDEQSAIAAMMKNTSLIKRPVIEFEKEMLEFHKSSQKVSSEEEVWKENLSKPFLKDNFGKWKTVMTKENIIRVEYICRHFFELEKQHYSRSAIQTRSNVIKSLSILADYHTTETKRRIRRMMNGRKTKEQLDKMPPYERMRINGYLKK